MRWRGAKSRTRYFQANPSHPMPSQQTSAGTPLPTADQKIRVPSRPSPNPSSPPWGGTAMGGTVTSFPLRASARPTIIGRMSHAHQHGHHHPHIQAPARGPQRDREARRLTLTLGVALVAMLLEAAGGLFTHSLALLSD